MSAPLERFPAPAASPQPGESPAEMRQAILEFSKSMNEGLHAMRANVEGAETMQRNSLQRLDHMADTLDRWAQQQVQQLEQRLGAMQQQMDQRLGDTVQQLETLQAQAAEDRRRISQMAVQLAVHDQSVSSYGRTSDEVREKFAEMNRANSSRGGKIAWSIAGAVLVVLVGLQVVGPQKVIDLISFAESMIFSGSRL